MIKKVLIALGVLVVLVMAAAATRPSEFRVTRSNSIKAPAAAIFPLVNNLHKYNKWSPWAKLDPQAKYTFEGPESGVGASVAWVGNRNVGEGKMSIIESKPNELIRMNLEFIKPFASVAMAEYTFTTEADHTTVSWSMSGKANFLSKLVGLFMDCDAMVGSEFEKGLVSLKAMAESGR